MGTIFKSGIAYLGAGGGNANQEELTWDEYEALTEEEKTNGTVYYITDADEIQPDKFRPVIYSEDEREIGVWTDGKPLYQKTTFVTPGNTVSMTGLSLKHAQCYSISTSGGITSVPYNDGSYICWWMSSDAIRFATQRSDISQYVITYQYTKDSDFAGSGKWTPQGIPAVHYSTDEHIVGTWINSKPLYEKTIIATNLVSTGTRTTLTTPVLTNCEVISFDGYFTRSVQALSGSKIKYPIGMYEGPDYFTKLYYDEYLGTFAYAVKFNTDPCTEMGLIIRYIKTTD